MMYGLTNSDNSSYLVCTHVLITLLKLPDCHAAVPLYRSSMSHMNYTHT